MGYRKGYSFEWSLKKLLEENGWTVVRSGASRKPDMIAAMNGEIMVIECKSTKKSKVYIAVEEVERLERTARAFGGTGVFAIKIDRKGFVLVPSRVAKRVGAHYVIDFESVKSKEIRIG